MRRLLCVAAFAFLIAGTAAAVPRTPVLIVASVEERAQEMMPPALWRKIVAAYVGGRPVRIEDGTQLPEDATCRGLKASYAVFARFDRAMRLPGLAQDTDRLYAIARFTVRNCLTGSVAPTKTIRLESDPFTLVTPRYEASVERAWQRAIHALAQNPLPIGTASRVAASSVTPAAVAAPGAPAFRARIVRVEGEVVILDSGRRMSPNQLLRVVADAKGNRYATPIDLVVLDIIGKYAQAAVIGQGGPRSGDYVEPVQP